MDVQTLARLAHRAGFVQHAGIWEKVWPSWNVWTVHADGSNPVIYDQHGRVIRTEADGITTLGMLMECLK